MAINYAEKYSSKVDEKFKLEAKTQALVNNDYDFVGAKTVQVYTVSTVAMGAYTRSGSDRYGSADELDTSLQELTLSRDRAFTFTVDKMNEDETNNALEVGRALARQLRERVIPEVDKYRLTEMADNAGNEDEGAITSETVYGLIVAGTEELDEAEVPADGRRLVVNPATHSLMKQSDDIILDESISKEERQRGVVGFLDGMEVVKVPASRMKTGTHFLIVHPIATVSPIKLAEYKIHRDPPGISGALVEGRVYYDAFVLDNKNDAIYLYKAATVSA